MDKYNLERLFSEAQDFARACGHEAITVSIAWWDNEDEEVHAVIRELNTDRPVSSLRLEQARRKLKTKRKRYPGSWFWFVVIADNEKASSDIETRMRARFAEEALKRTHDRAIELKTSATALVVYSDPHPLSVVTYTVSLGLKALARERDKQVVEAVKEFDDYAKERGVPPLQVFVAGREPHARKLAASIREDLNIPSC